MWLQGAYLVPPLARILMWRAVMPLSLHRTATSCAANMAAYGLACWEQWQAIIQYIRKAFCWFNSCWKRANTTHTLLISGVTVIQKKHPTLSLQMMSWLEGLYSRRQHHISESNYNFNWYTRYYLVSVSLDLHSSCNSSNGFPVINSIDTCTHCIHCKCIWWKYSHHTQMTYPADKKEHTYIVYAYIHVYILDRLRPAYSVQQEILEELYLFVFSKVWWTSV